MDCPMCGSCLVQPLKWQPTDDGGVMVELRCPECLSWSRAPSTRAGVEALDRAQAAARQTILDAYERVVSESMEALAYCLGTALALDLVAADDFAPPRRLRAV